MEILPVKAKLNVDVKADLTPAVQATADTISTSHKGVGKLLNAFVGPWIANRERAIALLQAQTQHDCQFNDKPYNREFKGDLKSSQAKLCQYYEHLGFRRIGKTEHFFFVVDHFLSHGKD